MACQANTALSSQLAGCSRDRDGRKTPAQRAVAVGCKADMRSGNRVTAFCPPLLRTLHSAVVLVCGARPRCAAGPRLAYCWPIAGLLLASCSPAAGPPADCWLVVCCWPLLAVCCWPPAAGWSRSRAVRRSSASKLQGKKEVAAPKQQPPGRIFIMREHNIVVFAGAPTRRAHSLRSIPTNTFLQAITQAQRCAPPNPRSRAIA